MQNHLLEIDASNFTEDITHITVYISNEFEVDDDELKKGRQDIIETSDHRYIKKPKLYDSFFRVYHSDPARTLENLTIDVKVSEGARSYFEARVEDNEYDYVDIALSEKEKVLYYSATIMFIFGLFLILLYFY
ncbi:hypothetical protein [Salisediminibacterium halotolerans]|uniref:hypothetical protein n=1 Tax=Salisediminibacterium halotolerans TaxID=517425 RepID=UPI000EAE989B|nr:hypothetical protein [Salisediminibacterium halotolerans]RLJ72237.1 hypothetical protein BCL39_2132 [Actinophytocola xinjiangensis]RPE85450.1 hypothetical protein EDD67_2267 [Salisediminibacterium halotolerans]TWG33407.1 hypothetical protein BCL52_2128 [Salisediminibacterium halotolerans]GEL07871.1 hypothetical protein SHA02_12870 [Salisediminibacterium halotolerans]